MTVTFEARVLNHKDFTGVENYTKNILSNIKDKINIKVVKPKIYNKYLDHLWMHLVLPFISTDMLFCPANIAPLFLPNKKKLIVTIHDCAFITQEDSFSTIFRIYYKYVIPKVIKKAYKIITVSNSSKEEILKYYPFAKDKIVVAQLGCDSQFRTIDSIKKRNQILYVGSMNKRKNFISVLQAYEKLDFDMKLVMVGNFNSNFSINSEIHTILHRSKENPNIKFLSNLSVEELVEVYNESKLFVYPSFYEGFGLPLLEAMNCKVPIICSNIASLQEVGDDCVVYVNPNNIDELYEKIRIVLLNENLQKDLIRKGASRAKKFTWQKCADMHIEVMS